jgi:hypothetical protein
MADALTLSQILSRGVSLEWHEGVAVVRGVMENLTSRGLTNVVPDLDQIQILPSGRIELGRGSKDSEPVRRLGQLLHATIGNADPPVKLRLVISEAMAPSPVFASFAEYDSALEYFERPDRAAVLRGVFERASALPASEAPEAPTLNTVAPLSPSPVVPKPGVRPKRRVAPYAAAAAVIFGIIAWVEYGRTSGAPVVGPGEVSAVVVRVRNSVGSTLVSGLSAITQRAGLGRLVSPNSETNPGENSETNPSDAPVASATKPPTASPRSTGTVSTTASGATRASATGPAMTESSRAPVRRVPAGTPAATAPAAPPATSRGEAVQVLAFDLDPNVRADRVALDAIEASRAAASSGGEVLLPAADDGTVYSVESTEVEPPVAVYPQLPTEVPANVARESLIEVELVVSAAGEVDSVRLLGQARRMYDGMWLSAIKAWQFRPAMKGANAVKYRKTVWIAALP